MAEDQWVIDVSRWQGVIDWARVKEAGVAGAWIKVGGSDGGFYRDAMARGNMDGAESAGVVYGTYYFAIPRAASRDDAYQQAEHAVSIEYGRGGMWPVLDLEDNPNGLTGEQLDRWVVDFCDRAIALIGRDSMLYTGLYDGIGYQSAGHPHCPLWIANYGTNQPGTEPPNFEPPVPHAWSDKGWSAWQFNSVTQVPGIVGYVDQNTVKGEFWEQMLGLEEQGEDDMPALTGIVRTKVGSEWALEHVGRNDVSAYLLTMEGSRTVRWLSGDALNVELFWAGKQISEVWEVEDNYLAGRYKWEEWEEGDQVAGNVTGAGPVATVTMEQSDTHHHHIGPDC